MIATYPLDLVRTRIAWEVESFSVPRTSGMLGVMQHIMRQEGIAGLYRVRCHPEIVSADDLHILHYVDMQLQ